MKRPIDHLAAVALACQGRDHHARLSQGGVLTVTMLDGSEPPTLTEIEAAWAAWDGPPPRWSAEEFIERLTMTEQLAILGSDDPMVRLFTAKLYAAGSVVSDDQRTQQGMAYLVSKGLLTEERRAQILARD